MVDLRRKLATSQIAEVVTALLVICWRVIDRAADNLWRDWLLILSLYWIFSVFAVERRTWTVGTAVFLVGLTALYLSGHLPQTVQFWNQHP
jgi:hypothetical protein